MSSGEGATSEGEFFEALNYAVRDQLPVLFLVQKPRELQELIEDFFDVSRKSRLAI